MLSSISKKSQTFTNWIGKQVQGSDDFGSGDTRMRDYAVIGASAGAVVGGVAGTYAGFKSQATTSIEEVWNDRNVTHPRMTGYTHRAVPDYSTHCTGSGDDEVCTTEIDGYWHRYSPDISNRIVGNFTEPSFRNTNFLEPLSGALLGAIGGSAIGMAAGIGIAALQKSLEDGPAAPPVRLSPEKKEQLASSSGKTVLATTAIGAGVGAFLGAQAGSIEAGAQEVHTRTWAAPVTTNETLGYIPRDHYSWMRFASHRGATERVVRPVPVYDGAGRPTFYDRTETFTTDRYGSIIGGLAGGVLGAGVGLASGVAIGLTQKLIAKGEETPTEQERFVSPRVEPKSTLGLTLETLSVKHEKEDEPKIVELAASKEAEKEKELTTFLEGPFEVKAITCSQCGAPTKSGSCGYCGSELSITRPEA